ncbi:MAG: ATP synthase F1 subunit delta [Planctomycetota bacterium]|jgi:F-type H+-transporting ATPase subunit delta
MPATDDTVIAIADAYAEALLELSESQGNSDRILAELAELAACFEKDAAVADFFSSPAVDDQTRQDALEKMFRGRLNDLLVDALCVLNSKGRASIVPAVYERFRLALERVRGEVDVQVTSAHPLTSKLRDRLREVLGRQTGRRPRLIERVDPAMLGGLVVQIGDEKLDCSAARRLQLLGQAFRERASREIHAGKAYFEGTDS